MTGFPIRYVDPVFRPPSEADSLILPLTDGCSWNHCTFCEMYTAPHKRFRARDEAATLASIQALGERCGDDIRRVFLADGDALVLPTRRLLAVLHAIRTHLPAVHRVSSYCLPRNLRKKSATELQELADAGLKLAYVGAESGNDLVLERIKKGETQASTRHALEQLAGAGIKRSVMILNGLGGTTHSEAHAHDSAALINATQPEFLATLVVSFPHSDARLRAGFPDWQALDSPGLFHEMRQFIAALSLRRTVFRSDHVSNRLVLRGTLGADQAKFLQQIDLALTTPGQAGLRPVSRGRL